MNTVLIPYFGGSAMNNFAVVGVLGLVGAAVLYAYARELAEHQVRERKLREQRGNPYKNPRLQGFFLTYQRN